MIESNNDIKEKSSKNFQAQRIEEAEETDMFNENKIAHVPSCEERVEKGEVQEMISMAS